MMAVIAKVTDEVPVPEIVYLVLLKKGSHYIALFAKRNFYRRQRSRKENGNNFSRLKTEWRGTWLFYREQCW
jgi:hypothetical protein